MLSLQFVRWSANQPVASAVRTASMETLTWQHLDTLFAFNAVADVEMANGHNRATASVTFCALKPPLKTARGARSFGTRDQSKTFPPPPKTLDERVEQDASETGWRHDILFQILTNQRAPWWARTVALVLRQPRNCVHAFLRQLPFGIVFDSSKI